MTKMKFLLFSLSFIFLLNSSLSALNRDYFVFDKYCGLHQEENGQLISIKKYLDLIPESSGRCVHMDCTKCKNAYFFDCVFFDEDEDDTCYYEWWCDCKWSLFDRKMYTLECCALSPTKQAN